MTTTPVLVREQAGRDDRVGPTTFLDAVVARLHAEYGVDAQVIRALAVEALAGFAGARVQTFVPILVEKRLREICRHWG